MFGLITRVRSAHAVGLLGGLLITALPVSTAATTQQGDAAQCRPGTLTRVPELPEASGLAVSRRSPDRLWTHNDSGQPVLFSLNASGKVTGRLQVTGAAVGDWEAIAVGPCGAGSCVYIGDIGDNSASRDRITIYRLPEPEGANGPAAAADSFHATYPDGSHDAEALLIDGDGRLYIVTKGETGPIALYRFPAALRAGMVHRLERVGAPASPKAGPPARITDGSVSLDGQWAVLRTHSALVFYRAADLLAGRWDEANRVDLAAAREPQGEGVALGPGSAVFIAGEGGGNGQPGTFGRFTCVPRE